MEKFVEDKNPGKTRRDAINEITKAGRAAERAAAAKPEAKPAVKVEKPRRASK